MFRNNIYIVHPEFENRKILAKILKLTLNFSWHQADRISCNKYVAPHSI